MNFFCYVLGCNSDRADVSAIHRSFGRVASCLRHHPDNGALGVGFGSLDAPAPAAAPAPAPAPQGGESRQRVLQPVSPTRPTPTRPAGGLATLPTVDPATARQRVADARLAAVQAAAAAGGAL